MLHYRTIFLLLACALSTACNDSDKVSKAIQDAQSWIASAQMVARAYGDGAVPQKYAHDALTVFTQQLQSTAKQVQATSDARAVETAASLTRAEQAIIQIDSAVERTDHLSLAQFDLQLENEQRQLTALVNPQSGTVPKP